MDEAVDVLLDTRGAGDGDLNFAVYDSSDYKPVESSCVSNRDGTTTCSFTPRKAVKHVAVATFGGAIVASFPHLVRPAAPLSVTRGAVVFVAVVVVTRVVVFVAVVVVTRGVVFVTVVVVTRGVVFVTVVGVTYSIHSLLH